MRGGILGDLAAWTYEYDEYVFYSRLIDNKADISFFCNILVTKNSVTSKQMEGEDCHAIFLMQSIASYFTGVDCVHNNLSPFVTKEDEYAVGFVKVLLQKLYDGATKSQAFYGTENFEQMTKHWNWKPQDGFTRGLLSCVFRAWNAFYLGFDFTSTLHNAVKWKKDRHIVAILAGLFADAMYGSQHGFLKKKYAKVDTMFALPCLDVFLENADYNDQQVTDFSESRRTFFPKNQALTNVEFPCFQKMENIFSKCRITKEQYAVIKKAFVTDWDNRYGFYLDNGWIYVYRSRVLICRLKFVEEGDGYRVDGFETIERGFHCSCSAINAALYSCRLYDTDIYKVVCTSK